MRHPLDEPHPISSGFDDTRSWGKHAASDYAVTLKPTYACVDGKIIFVGWAGNGGTTIELEDGKGLRLRYMHLQSTEVSIGQSVTEGQRIGTTGNTTNIVGGVGYHLHFAVWLKTLEQAQKVQNDPYPTQGWYAVDPEKWYLEEDEMLSQEDKEWMVQVIRDELLGIRFRVGEGVKLNDVMNVAQATLAQVGGASEANTEAIADAVAKDLAKRLED